MLGFGQVGVRVYADRLPMECHRVSKVNNKTGSFLPEEYG